MSGRAAASAPPGRVMVKGVVLGVGLKVALDLDWLVKHEDSIAMIWDVPLQFLSLKIFRTNFKAQSSMMSDHIQMKSWKLRVTNPSKPPGRGLWFGVSMEMSFWSSFQLYSMNFEYDFVKL